MKKVVLLFGLLFLFLSFVIAQEDTTCAQGDDDCRIDKAYSCLNEKINDKSCDSLSSEESVFSLLATGKCKNQVTGDSKYLSNLEYTSQALLGLKGSGSTAKDWLFDNNMTSIGIDWFLEIESPKKTTCSVDYSNSNEIIINEDKTIGSITGGNCLSTSSNGYWVEVNPNCYDEEFTVSCDEQFLTTLLYQKQNSETIHVLEKTSSSSSEGTTKEKVESLCFSTSSNECDYPGTLWATLALSSLGSDITPYLPYLITMEEDNEDLLPESFLYFVTGNNEFKNRLLSQQIDSKWWISDDDKFYGTALALYPFQYEEPPQKSDTIDWLLDDVQEEDGCWSSGNIKNTAFLLASVFPRTTSVGGSDVSCEGAGNYCVSQINCLGDVLPGYSCSGAFVCCSTDVVLETCSELNGEICNSNQNCVGTGSVEVEAAGLGVGQACCVSGTCQEQTTQTSSCESSGGICRVNKCLDGEEQSFESCDFSSDLCCVQETKKETNYFWIWFLFILIILVVVGIIFRDKLRPYWFMIKSKFDKFRSPSGDGPPAPGPGSPPPRRPTLRRVAPTRRHSPGRVPRAKAQGEIDEVLNKLKEMGK